MPGRYPGGRNGLPAAGAVAAGAVAAPLPSPSVLPVPVAVARWWRSRSRSTHSRTRFLQGGRVHLAGHDGAIAASHATASAASPSSHAPPSPPPTEASPGTPPTARGPGPSTPPAAPSRPRASSGRPATCGPRPSPAARPAQAAARRPPAASSPPAAYVEPLRLLRVSSAPGRSRQRIQHRAAPPPPHSGRQVPGQHAGPVEGRLQLHRPVLKRLVLIAVGGPGEGPGVDLPPPARSRKSIPSSPTLPGGSHPRPGGSPRGPCRYGSSARRTPTSPPRPAPPRPPDAPAARRTHAVYADRGALGDPGSG